MSEATNDTKRDVSPSADDDDDDIFAELEAEVNDTTSAAHQARLEELKAAAGKSQTTGNPSLPATTIRQDSYLILNSDDETLRFTTEHEKAVVHFRHPDFHRCSIMDQHLDRIAQRHGYSESGGDDLSFARVNVTDVPFVVEKLGIKVLPCVIGFHDGAVKGRVIGFEGICWDGKEKDPRVSKELESLLFSWGLLKQKMLMDDHDTESENEDDNEARRRTNMGRRGIRGPAKATADDSDEDWN